MNDIAYSLNCVKACQSRVWSLHDSAGETRYFFATRCNLAASHQITSMLPHLAAGGVIVVWVDGEPVGTIANPVFYRP